jgi:hypothetical protein
MTPAPATPAARTTVTGPRHPLLARIDQGHRARATYLPVAQEILADHRDHATSDQSVYRLYADARYDRVGTHEDHSQLISSDLHAIAVHTNMGADELADQIAHDQLGARLRGYQGRAEALRDAAEKAAPQVAVLLAVCVRAELVDWDTDESVQAAGRRLALDAGWRLLGRLNPVIPRPRDIFTDVADALNLVARPASDYAAAYLAERDQIDAALAARGIRWGGRSLTALDAASRAQVAGSTWRAYVARDEAPTADEGGLWRCATVDAWRLTRTSPTQTAWWA